jgi:hypothetical protein
MLASFEIEQTDFASVKDHVARQQAAPAFVLEVEADGIFGVALHQHRAHRQVANADWLSVAESVVRRTGLGLESRRIAPVLQIGLDPRIVVDIGHRAGRILVGPDRRARAFAQPCRTAPMA